MNYLDRGKELHEQYRNAHPFPHIVLEGFFEDCELEGVLGEIHTIPEQQGCRDEHAYQQRKMWVPDVKVMPPRARAAFASLNAPPLLRFLSELTGIADVLPDPSLLGGGIHRITEGGRLEVHADFNLHPQLRLHRRLNVLVYLNPVWRQEWNGALELWERDMSRCAKEIWPAFNRAVIFTITDNAFHGHPKPLNGPERLSFATYYYTKDRPAHEISPFHWASWQRRPQ